MSKSEEWVSPSFEVDEELAESVGWFMISWGGLEHTIDHLFPVVFKIDPTLALCITANLGTKPKVEMLQSALAMISPILPPEHVETILDGLNRAMTLSSKYRNFVAHSRPIFTSEVDGTPFWIWGRYAARKQLTMFTPDTDAEIWLEQAKVVEDLSHEIFKASKQLHEAIINVSAEDWEEACLIRETKP